MTENKRFELRLCNNGTYYLWENNELTGIGFDKFNKESANELVDLLNELNDKNERLRSVFTELAELIEYDIENNIGVYPKTLLEYIISAIRKLGE